MATPRLHQDICRPAKCSPGPPSRLGRREAPGGVGRSLPRETRLYEGGLPNQIIEMLAKELIPACAEGSDPAGSSGSWPSNLRTSVGWA